MANCIVFSGAVAILYQDPQVKQRLSHCVYDQPLDAGHSQERAIGFI
jgi:hypothetical protein